MAITEAVEAVKARYGFPDTFRSVAVIGAGGKTGRFYVESLSSHAQIRRIFRESEDIGEIFEEGPDAVILATSNLDAKKALEDLARNIKKPTTLILSQNGVGIVELAEEVLADSRSQISIVRASLYTNVSDGSGGGIVYNKDKKIIDFAPVGVDQDGSAERTADLFREAGFDVKVHNDYRAMEWAKAMVNRLGSTSAITGSLEILNDPEIFVIEHRGIKDGLEILDAAGITVDGFRFIGRLRLLSWIPELVVRDIGVLGREIRRYVVNKLSAERNNQPSAVAGQIARGRRKVEATDYYHKPLIKLGESLGIESPADATNVEILKRHEWKSNDFSLASLSAAERRDLLLEIYGYEVMDVFVRGSDRIRAELELIHRIFTRGFEIAGEANLVKVAETLKAGKSVLIAPNHRSHADHPSMIKALRENLPHEVRDYPVYIVAGMKFDKESISGRYSRAYGHPVIWTLEEGDDEEARWRAQIVNKRAARVINKLLEEPSIFVVYLEGGRNKSKDLVLQPPAVASSLWLTDPAFDLVLPTAIRGTEKMLPPGKTMPRRADLTLEFCKPIETVNFRLRKIELLREYGAKPRGEQNHEELRRQWDREFGGEVLGAVALKLLESQRG